MQNDQEKLELLLRRKELCNSQDVKEVIEICKNRIIDLSCGGIDDKELRGMLKLIKFITDWEYDYDKYIKVTKGLNNL